DHSVWIDRKAATSRRAGVDGERRVDKRAIDLAKHHRGLQARCRRSLADELELIPLSHGLHEIPRQERLPLNRLIVGGVGQPLGGGTVPSLDLRQLSLRRDEYPDVSK